MTETQTYVLAKGSMRVALRNDRGTVKKRFRFSAGDPVSPEQLVEGRHDALVESGHLVPQSEYEANHVDPPADVGESEGASETDDGDEGSETTFAEPPYDEAEYSDLVKEVERRGLTPASQKKVDLITALDADDEAAVTL